MARKRTQSWLTAGAGVAIALALIYAFWPRAMLVDMGVVKRTAMLITIDEEARTRVRDAYVVSAPIAGRLLRVEVVPGDPVKGGGRSLRACCRSTRPRSTCAPVSRSGPRSMPPKRHSQQPAQSCKRRSPTRTTPMPSSPVNASSVSVASLVVQHWMSLPGRQERPLPHSMSPKPRSPCVRLIWRRRERA